MQVQTRGTLLDDSTFAGAIHHLARYHAEDGVLSVYLDLERGLQDGAHVKTLKTVLEPLHEPSRELWLQGRLEYEIARAVEAVESWQHAPGRAAAMFFCGPGGLETVIPLRFPVRSFARFGRRAALNPLIAALDEHRRYCVVTLDRRRARITSVMLGAVEDDVVIESDVTGSGDLGPGGGNHNAAHESEAHAQAMRVLEHLWAIDRSRPIHALILGGDADAQAMLRRVLPRALARIVIDERLDAGIDAIGPDIANSVGRLDQQARENEDGAVVARLLEDRTDDLAVKGWEPTLTAINEGRVQVLLQPDEGVRAGVFCPADHFVALEGSGRCPVCSEDLRVTEHVGEAAARSVLLRDGQVHALAPGAASDLRRFGVGAILRY